MITQTEPSTYAYQLFNEKTDAVDFSVDFYDSDLVNTSFSVQTFSRYDLYTIIWLYNGQGRFQVDFQFYDFAGAKMIFLTPGQYFNVEKGNFKIIRYAFTQAFFCVKEHNPETLCNGVLYNHLYAVASIEVETKEQGYFQQLHKDMLGSFKNHFVAERSLIKKQLGKLLSFAVQTWLRQQPLSPDLKEEETDILFALKKTIDQHYKKTLSIESYAERLAVSEKKLSRLLKNRLDINVSDLIIHRQLLEAKRDLYFTSKSIKEIALDLGFSDPAYFNRFFKKHGGITPKAFRKKHGVKHWDENVKALAGLIDKHFKENRNVSFYADELHLTSRTLSDMVKRVLNKTVGELIKLRLVLEAKRHLYFSEKSIKDIAFELGFEEPAYFSYFFKNATAVSPEEFRSHWQSLGQQKPAILHQEFGLFNWMNKSV